MNQIEDEFNMTCGGLRKIVNHESLVVSVEQLREWFLEAPESQV